MTGDLQAFVDEPNREARVASELAKAPAGSLSGTRVGVKDMIRVDGLPTRAGSQLPPELFEGPEASVVTRLRQAGAVIEGKTHTAEFAWAAPGPTRNPLDPRRTPGGSSSGSAAAVGACMVPLALGTQTIGSVIRPASFCGVYGFKPSFGRVAIDGVIACAPSLDTLGWFAPDLDGIRTAACVLCDGWGEPDGRGRVLGVPEGPYLDQAEPATRRWFETQVMLLAAQGWTVKRIAVLDDIADIAAAHVRIVGAEMADVHEEWFAEHEDLYAPATADMIRWGSGLGDVEAERAGQLDLRARLEAAEVDVWVSPASTGPAPVGLGSTGDPAMNLPWTYAGLPVVSLPLGTVDGLPVGLQCAGRFGADESLLAPASLLVSGREPEGR